jgi:hypothetical protein
MPCTPVSARVWSLRRASGASRPSPRGRAEARRSPPGGSRGRPRTPSGGAAGPSVDRRPLGLASGWPWRAPRSHGAWSPPPWTCDGPPGGGGVHRAGSARGGLPGPQPAPGKGGVPGVDDGAQPAARPGPPGRAAPAPPAPSPRGPGVGGGELGGQARGEPPDVSCLDARPPPSGLAAPGGVVNGPGGSRDVGNCPSAPRRGSKPHRDGGFKPWQLLPNRVFML